MRKLKFNEQKLLKKTDFITWEVSSREDRSSSISLSLQVDQEGKQNEMLRKYGVTKREHYTLYNTLARQVRLMLSRSSNKFVLQARDIAEKLKTLPNNDPYKAKKSRELLGKLYSLGIIASADTLERIGSVCSSIHNNYLRDFYCILSFGD